jgi:hypothetical protein
VDSLGDDRRSCVRRNAVGLWFGLAAAPLPLPWEQQAEERAPRRVPLRGVEAVVDLDEPAVVEQIVDAELEADMVADR